MKKVYCQNIEKLTEKNKMYRKVLYTNSNGMQFVVMSLKIDEMIGMEKHSKVDQFIRIESGSGMLHIKTDDIIKKYNITDGFGIVIPSNVCHNIINNKNKVLTKTLLKYNL